MRAVLFPGQGSQYVGMGSDFYNKFDSTKSFFEIVDKTLGFSLSNIILNDSLNFGLFTNPFVEFKGAGRVLETVGNYYAHYIFGVRIVKLEVFSDNTRAINFYKKCDFRFVGLNRYKEKEVVLMEKSRDPSRYDDKYNKN